MPTSNGIITAPVDFRDPYICLGVGQYNGWWDDVYVCCNKHGKTNRFSYYKPIRGYGQEEHKFNDIDYYDSLTTVKYKIGNPIPESFIYAYNHPIENTSDWARITDFIGYNHAEQIQSIYMDEIPDILDYDYYKNNINIWEGNSNRPLMQILLNARGASLPYQLWYNTVILIIEKGSIKRYFSLQCSTWSEWRMITYMPESREWYNLFRSIDLGSYTCTFLAAMKLFNHPDKPTNFHEILPSQNFEYIIYPETNGDRPFKKNFKITTPRKASFWSVGIHESGNGIESYIPENAIIGGDFVAMKPNGAGDDLWNESGGITFSEWKRRSGDLSGGIISEGRVLTGGSYNKFDGSIYVNYYNFGTTANPLYVKPTIQSYTSGGVVTDVPSNKMVLIRFQNMDINNENNYMEVGFYFNDPNYRPN